MVIPHWLKNEYPFSSQFLKLKSGYQLHYVDQGVGEVVLMLHGNPTWSFFYRNLIKGLSDKFRVIVPDHLGCGVSDKPQDYSYTLENHIENVCELISHLEIKKLRLIVHDWGGAIGFGVLRRMPDLAEKITILNTAAFTSTYIPAPIAFCRIPWFGEKMIRNLNGFAGPATFMAVEKKLSPVIKRGFLFPYQNSADRIAIARFVKDIPMKETHPSYDELKKIELSLPQHTCPKLVLWGKKDFCFNDYFLDRWKKIYPEAEFKELKKAGHYLLEDNPAECLQEIRSFL